MSQRVQPPVPVDYPSSDGKSIAENDAQRAAIMYAIGALEIRFSDRSDVYVSGDLLPVTGQRLVSHAEEHSARTVADARPEVAEVRVAELEALLRERGGAPGPGE